MCRRLGLDLARDPIPVGPAAHYIMGGVETDEWGRTSLAGLFAAGEVACTGVHGANRLASNSLLEGLVFGARAASAMQQSPIAARLKPDRHEASLASPSRVDQASASQSDAAMTTAAVRELMWRSAGLFRTRQGLEEAVRRLERAYLAEQARKRQTPPDGESWRHFNLVTVAKLIASAALRREESRGAHFREDFPARDDRSWKYHMVDRRPPE